MSVLVFEIRARDISFVLPVVPPLVRAGKEDLPQAKPVFVLVFFKYFS
jgi:hypothetical protein